MNRLIVGILLGIAMCSMVLGAAATKMNYRILPSIPISINPREGVNQTAFKIDKLNITGLLTGTIEIYPSPHFGSTLQAQFAQGDVLGIAVSISVDWDSEAIQFFNSSSVTEKNSEFIYFEGNLSGHLVTTIHMHDPDGRLVADNEDIALWSGQGDGTGTGTSRYYIQIPYDWKPGTYTIRANVEDLFTTLEDSQETSISILSGSPPQEKHPSPIDARPEDLIIGLNDLAEGWNVDFENSGCTILEGCVASFERGFNKVVGEFTYIFDVRIIQFENASEANKSFQSRLEAMLTNEKYGHGKVLTEDLGDSCFLYDNAERRSPEWRGWEVDGKNSTSWATGSCVTFLKENIVVVVSDNYNYAAISQGVYLTPEQLIGFARIQEAKIQT